MASFRELQDDVYFWLGTSDRNAAFPRAQVKRLANMAKDAVYHDCLRTNPDVLTRTATLSADGDDATKYVFSAQSPAVTNAGFLVEVRTTDARGDTLDEVPFGERYRRSGRTYSLIGHGAALVLYTGPNVTSGVALYCAYAPQATDLATDESTPAWLPAEFHDVLSLRAAKLAAGSGNEQTLSPLLLETSEDREAQMRQAFGRRSLSPTLLRTR